MISKYSALHRAKHNRFLFPVAFICIYLSMRITFVNLKEWNFNFQSSQKISPVHAFRISTIPFLVRLNFWSLFTQQARQAKNLCRFFRLQMHLFLLFSIFTPQHRFSKDLFCMWNTSCDKWCQSSTSELT